MFADALNLLVFPFPLLALLTSVSWYFVFNPPYRGRLMRLRKRSLRRRETVRFIFLTLALCCTVVLAAFIYGLVTGTGV
jgi:hypothetical protein